MFRSSGADYVLQSGSINIWSLQDQNKTAFLGNGTHLLHWHRLFVLEPDGELLENHAACCFLHFFKGQADEANMRSPGLCL
jgi:hypothetical protein